MQWLLPWAGSSLFAILKSLTSLSRVWKHSSMLMRSLADVRTKGTCSCEAKFSPWPMDTSSFSDWAKSDCEEDMDSISLPHLHLDLSILSFYHLCIHLLTQKRKKLMGVYRDGSIKQFQGAVCRQGCHSHTMVSTMTQGVVSVFFTRIICRWKVGISM